ncbi:MAG: dihydroneopterin aldolase [Actinobacteria bacterium]|nr:dihydroneopterin aldolase [Actinomycetota bacterium]
MSEMAIELEGLEVRGFHGATADEQVEGQTFLYDVRLVAHDAAIRSDQLADTVDYTKVVACILEVSQERRYNLIEALAGAVADALIERFPVSRATVRVRKPEVRLAAPIAFTAATVERARR